MANSANYNTADRIIRAAMRDAGLLEKGQDPDGEDYADYMNRLNDLINFEQTQGLKLWLNSLINITMVQGQASYILGPGTTSVQATKSMRILEAYFYYANGISYPLNVLSWNAYNLLSNTNQQGQPNSYFVDKQQLYTNLVLWLVPDSVAAATGNFIQILQQTPVNNLVNLTDTMNFPQEWAMFLHWALADDICTGQPQAIMDRCAQKAAMYRTMLEDWDVEDASTSFSPDGQSNSVSASAFR